ncbi:winged helix-turn-helix domain-containing protein [Kordiimonas aquimaris]|uniref:winged helix-turn-helix domain-containing protein n=1 Tax=Kordiimonas aquimaris TaxID=707591 RepID=UPI0021D1A3A7|nr:winged helix-turn-helix domain-containing protein [Kordiimonas aquimaris]
MTKNPENQRHNIYHWVFIPGEKLLQHSDGHAVKLEDKIAKLLLTFCMNRGRLVTKSDIIAAVWDGRELSEQTIPVAISKLRKALGDDINNPKMLETIPRRGYRLLDELPKRKAHSVSETSKPTERIIFYTAMIAIAVLGGLYLFTGNENLTPDRIQLANAEKPGVIVTINDVRTTKATEDKIDQAIAISELSSFFLAQVPDILVIRHWWNLDAPDPTGGIYTRYGNATPVYSLKATLLKEDTGNIVTFILSEPKTDEVLWTGLHKVNSGSESLFGTLSMMLDRLSVVKRPIDNKAPNEDLRYWNARYYMHLSNPSAANKAYSYLTAIADEKQTTKQVLATEEALMARWREQLVASNNQIDLNDYSSIATDPISSGVKTHTEIVDKAAIQLYRHNKPNEAIELLEEAFLKAPGDHYALSLIAEAKERIGLREEALTAYRKAIRLAPYARAYQSRLKEIENKTSDNAKVE